MSGSVSRGKNDPSQNLQMIERPLMTPDELKSIPKGEFIVMKTGTHPMRTRLRLFLEWGITFGEPYVLPERAARPVAYATRQELEQAILQKHPLRRAERPPSSPPLPAGADDGGQRQKGQTHQKEQTQLDAARELQELRKNRKGKEENT